MKQPKKDTLTPRLKEVLKEGKKFFKDKLPKVVHREGLDFISGNFDNEGFRNQGVQKWPARKPSKSKKQRAGRSILVDKGHLRRSWELDSNYNQAQVLFQSSRPYAGVHNEGGQAGRGSGFTMPQRQMIGPSEIMARMIEDKLTREMDKIIY